VIGLAFSGVVTYLYIYIISAKNEFLRVLLLSVMKNRINDGLIMTGVGAVMLIGLYL